MGVRNSIRAAAALAVAAGGWEGPRTQAGPMFSHRVVASRVDGREDAPLRLNPTTVSRTIALAEGSTFSPRWGDPWRPVAMLAGAVSPGDLNASSPTSPPTLEIPKTPEPMVLGFTPIGPDAFGGGAIDREVATRELSASAESPRGVGGLKAVVAPVGDRGLRDPLSREIGRSPMAAETVRPRTADDLAAAAKADPTTSPTTLATSEVTPRTPDQPAPSNTTDVVPGTVAEKPPESSSKETGTDSGHDSRTLAREPDPVASDQALASRQTGDTTTSTTTTSASILIPPTDRLGSVVNAAMIGQAVNTSAVVSGRSAAATVEGSKTTTTDSSESGGLTTTATPTTNSTSTSAGILGPGSSADSMATASGILPSQADATDPILDSSSTLSIPAVVVPDEVVSLVAPESDTVGLVPTPSPVPEPSTLALPGLVALAWLARRSRR